MMDMLKQTLEDEIIMEHLYNNPSLCRLIISGDHEFPRKELMKLRLAYKSPAKRTHHIDIFQHSLLKCCIHDNCKSVLQVKKVLDATLYDDIFGTSPIKVISKYCRSCKLIYYPGFYESYIDQVRFYEDNWDQYQVFVSTIQISFSVDFLYRAVALKQKCNSTFHGRADAYNYHHDNYDTCRLDHRRLIDAYYKFIVLKFKSRHHLNLQIKVDIQKTLVEEYDNLYSEFVKKYSTHYCDIPGCTSCLVVDGHMKAHRKVCKQSGCTYDPKHRSLYCQKHEQPKHLIQDGCQVPNKDEYIIEDILNKKYDKKSKHFLYEIKWLNSNEATWECRENIPRVSVELYERYGSLKIIVEYETISISSKKFIKVKHNNETFILPECSIEVNESAYYIATPDEVKCDTSKTKSTFYHRTGGILMIAKPCGIIIHCSEIFGGESVISVAEMIEETLQQIKQNIEVVVYDDGCHLAKHKNKKPFSYPNLSKCEIKIDKFHYRNHIDKWCKENMNPKTCIKLSGVNTEIMEQTFSWLKKFSSSLKYMNKVTFNFMIMDIVDRHNIEIERKKNLPTSG